MPKQCLFCGEHVSSGDSLLVLKGQWDGFVFTKGEIKGVACLNCGPAKEDYTYSDDSIADLVFKP